VCLDEFFGRSKALPWKRARTLSAPRRLAARVLNETRLRYVQLDRRLTLRDETVVVRFWKRTFTLPLQMADFGGVWQYAGLVVPEGQISATQLPPSTAAPGAQNLDGGTTLPLVVNV